MTALDQLRTLWRHAAWADARLLDALAAAPEPAAVREMAHVVGAEEVWLSRLEGRAPRSPIWPEPDLARATALAAENRAGYARLLGALTDDGLAATVSYATSAGQPFATPVGDVLLQVVLHGQYHRGRVNALLREAGADPAPVDYILWQRAQAAGA